MRLFVGFADVHRINRVIKSINFSSFCDMEFLLNVVNVILSEVLERTVYIQCKG